ncbi:hypothetical protein KCU83_g515, partial [Aureobasidium melanogenum]
MSLPSLPSYKAVCESAEDAQRLADNVARVAFTLQVGALNSALMYEQMMAAMNHQRGCLGQRALLEQTADLLANNVALLARIAELEQQLRAARPAQPAVQAPTNASSNGRSGHGEVPAGPCRDDAAGGAGASGVGA